MRRLVPTMRMAVVSVAAMLATFTSHAQQLPDNPLSDKLPARLPGNPLGPIHFLPMDESADDTVGKITPTVVQNVSPIDGYVDGGLYFDGTSIVGLPIDISASKYPNLTIVTYVKTDALIDGAAADGTTSSGYVLKAGDTYILLSGQRSETPLFTGRASSAQLQNMSTHKARRGEWQMVALTRKLEDRVDESDGVRKKHVVAGLYVDGAWMESSIVYRPESANENLYLGNLAPGTIYALRAALDHLTIQAHALSKEDLDDLYSRFRSRANAERLEGWRQARGERTEKDAAGQSGKDLGKEPVELSDGDIEKDIAGVPSGPDGVDPELFPGDMFAADGEERFPGDMFENDDNVSDIKPVLDPNATEAADRVGSSSDVRLTNEGEPSARSLRADDLDPDRTADTSGAADLNAEDFLANEMDEAARDEAVRQAGIDAARGKDVGTPPSVDPATTRGINTQTVAADQRDAAQPAATIPDTGGETATEPVSTVKDVKEVSETEAGQDRLKPADWRIVGVVQATADVDEIYPGDAVTVNIRVRKNDPVNRIPEVQLLARAARSGADAHISQRLIINTNKFNPEVTRDLPVTLRVPPDIEIPEGSSAVLWKPIVWLNAKDGRPLRDANPDNHRRELALSVRRQIAPALCGGVSQNDDGSRTTGECLSLEDAYMECNESLARVDGLANVSDLCKSVIAAREAENFSIDLSKRVNTNISGNALPSGDNTSALTFSSSLMPTDAVFQELIIGERADKPCKVEIGGNKPLSSSSIDRCKGEVGDKLKFNVAKNRAITGLRVCQRKANSRVKGVWIETRPMLADASLGDDVIPQEDEQTNCNEWRTTVRCPDGMAAGGILAAFDSGSGMASRDFMTGLGLICGPIVFESDS